MVAPRSRLLTLFLIVFVDLVGFGVIIPLLPFYGEHYDASPLAVGLLMATYSLAQFVTAPLWGRLSDRTGRRPVLLLSLGGAVLAYVGLAFAGSLWMLFAARAFGGAMAGNIATAFAYVADITPPGERARGMGVIGAGFGLGFIFGPAIGGVLAGSDPATADFTTPALAAAALSALALLLAALRLPESLAPETRALAAAGRRRDRWRALRDAVGVPVTARLILLTFLSTFVFAGMETIFALWSRRQFGWGPEQNGYLFAFIGVISAGIQGGLIGRLARRFGEPRLVLAGAAALAGGLLLIPLAATPVALVPVMALIAAGFSLMTPSLSSLLSLQVAAHVQGATMGVSRSASTLARVLGPVWAGAVFAYLGRDWPFLGGGLVMAAVVLLGCRWLPTPPQRLRADAETVIHPPSLKE